MSERQRHIDECLEQLDQGTLTRERLLEAFAALGAEAGKRQDLLYLQAAQTGLHSSLLGMSMLVGGEYVEEPDSEAEWPYENVIDAINDGWRIISFPNMALSLQENRTYGLGFEFILEKWR